MTNVHVFKAAQARRAYFFKLNCRNQKDMDVQWNELDGSIDRRSHNGRYEVVNGLPR